MLRLVLMPVVAGFVATAGMTLVLWSINRSGWANADMVRALGSLVTRSYDSALAAGLVLHFAGGVVFAAVYLHILSVLELASLPGEIFVGGFLGFGQGFIVGWSIIRFAFRHPVERFQKADYQVAIAHGLGHVVYGMLVGAMFGAMRLAGYDVSPGF